MRDAWRYTPAPTALARLLSALSRHFSAGPVAAEPEQFPIRTDPVLERLGLQFLADFLEIAGRHHPDNVDALAELAHVYTRLGRYEDGLEVDQRLVRLVPDNATVHYNLACSLALCGHGSQALDALEQAVRLGYSDSAQLAQDEDLRSLRGEARFQALLARLEG